MIMRCLISSMREQNEYRSFNSNECDYKTELNRRFEVIGALARAELSEVSDETIEMLSFDGWCFVDTGER